MQVANTYQSWQRAAVAAPPRSGMVAYVRGFSLTIWLFSLLFGYWWVKDWFALQEMTQAGVNRKEYYYYGFSVALAGHLTLGLQAWFSAPFNVLHDWTGRLLTAFCILMLCLSPLSIVPFQSVVYSGATLVTVVLMSLFWASNYRVLQRVLVITGFVLFAWLFVLLLKHGLTQGFGGWIGGINRNTTGTAALAAMVCAILSPKRHIRLAAIATATFLIVVVSSRGSIVAMSAFFAIYYVLYKGTGKAMVYALLALGTFGVLLLTSPFVYELVVERVFHLHDQARGVGSGFTGRMAMWRHAFSAFWQRPIFGYGFRAASISGSVDIGGVHSGWLKIFIEGGIVGGLLVVAAFVVETVRRMRLAMNLRKMRDSDLPGFDLPQTLHLNIVACATYFMLATMWVYDQYYINLGSPISVVFFLFIMAPNWITSQGVTIRK